MERKNLKFISENDQSELLCPRCSNSYNHPVFNSIEVREGKDNYQASQYVRGDAMELPMQCENGHIYKLKIGCHKGSTYLWTEIYNIDDCYTPKEIF